MKSESASHQLKNLMALSHQDEKYHFHPDATTFNILGISTAVS